MRRSSRLSRTEKASLGTRDESSGEEEGDHGPERLVLLEVTVGAGELVLV